MGREAVRQAAERKQPQAVNWSLHDLKLFETPYPNIFFIESSARAFVPSTDRIYDGKHLARITVLDGKIASYYEIWNRDAWAAAFKK